MRMYRASVEANANGWVAHSVAGILRDRGVQDHAPRRGVFFSLIPLDSHSRCVTPTYSAQLVVPVLNPFDVSFDFTSLHFESIEPSAGITVGEPFFLCAEAHASSPFPLHLMNCVLELASSSSQVRRALPLQLQ
jgi:hypothetical protein